MQDQVLSNWQIKRQVGSSTPIVYKFPHKFTLKAEGSVTVSYSDFYLQKNLIRTSKTIVTIMWCVDHEGNTEALRCSFKNNLRVVFIFPSQIWASAGGGTHNPPTDLVWKSQSSWGTGDLLQTSLINANGEV